MFDLIMTIAVVTLVLMFVTLLIKLNPSSARDKDEEEIVQEASGSGSNLALQSKSHQTLSNPQSYELTSTRNRETNLWQNRQTSNRYVASEAPIEKTSRVTVSATVGGSSEIEKEPEMPSRGKLQEPKDPKPQPPSEPVPISQNSGEKKCPHKFGYLRGLPKNRPIPNECFGCPRIVDCLVGKSES